MDTREYAAEYRLARWAQIIQQRRESGLSIRAYCRREGMHENTFYYWQRKLRAAACEQLVESSSTSLTTQGFAQVCVAEPGQSRTEQETAETGCIHAEIRGIHITADDIYPTEKLVKLLRELSTC